MYKIYFLKKEQCCNFFDFWGNVRNKLMLCKKKVHIVPIWVSFVCLYCIHVKTTTMKIQYSQVLVISNSSGYWQIDFQPTDTNNSNISSRWYRVTSLIFSRAHKLI